MTSVRAAVCVEDPALKRAVLDLLGRGADFDVVIESESAEDLVSRCEESCPDLIVLDDRLATEPAADILLRAGMGVPVPALLLVESESQDRDERRRERRAQRSRVSRSFVVRADDVARAHVETRLALVASRLGRSHAKRTLSADAVMSAMEDVQARARRARVRDEVAQLASWPLDLITLVGAAKGDELAGEILSRMTAHPVPILLALESQPPGARAALAKSAHTKVSVVDQTMPLRKADGILIPAATSALLVDEHVVSEAAGTTDQARLVASMGTLRAGGLTVVLGEASAPVLEALREVVKGGGLVAVLETSPGHAVSSRAESAGISVTALDHDELAWLLSRAVARRA